MDNFTYLDSLLDDVNGADRIGDLLAADPSLVSTLNDVLEARAEYRHNA